MSKRVNLTDVITGIRINALRKEYGMRQSDLANALNKVAKAHGEENPHYTNSSVSKWESRGSIPRGKTLQFLSEIFNVSVAYLMGNSDSLISFKSVVTERNSFKEIDEEMLDMKYDGLPVWVEMDPDTGKGQYALVNADNRSLIFKDGSMMSYVDCCHKTYAGPNPFSISMMALEELPLKFEEIENGLRVWVEMIGATEAVRDTYRGWYIYYQSVRSFIGANGLPLPAAYYGKSFVAFNRPI